MAELNYLMEPNQALLDNWISNSNTDKKNNNKKHGQACFPSKRPHTITKMNNINMDNTIAGPVI